MACTGCMVRMRDGPKAWKCRPSPGMSRGMMALTTSDQAMSFVVYLLRCADGSYYVGQTDDLPRRLAEHEAGEGSSWTTKRLPVELVWSESFGTRDEALAAERQIKGWRRAKKEALVRGDWEAISELARNRQGPPPRQP